MSQSKEERDRVIADSGWGIKPDDQPANAADARSADAVRVYQYRSDEPDAIRKILRAQRKGFNTANRVRIEPGRTVIIDINKDEFIIEGLSYGDPNLNELLMHLGAAFNPQEIAQVKSDEKISREFSLSRVWA